MCYDCTVCDRGSTPTSEPRLEEGAYFARLRRAVEVAIDAADAGFQSESDDDESPQFRSEAANEFADVAEKLRAIREGLS